MIIDCHAHVLVPEHRASAGSHARLTGAGIAALPVWFDADRRLEAMERAGVDMEVVSPMSHLPGDDDLGSSSALAGRVNEFIADLVAETSGRIQGLGVVALRDPEAAAAGLSEVAALGLRGIAVMSHIQDASIGSPRFRDFFQEAERVGLAVVVHAPGPCSTPQRSSSRSSRTQAVNARLAAESLIADGTLHACPSLRLCVSHGAGGLTRNLSPRLGAGPAQTPTGNGGEPMTPPARASEGLARRIYYDTSTIDHRAIADVARFIGVDRMLFGTAFPTTPRQQPAVRLLEAVMDVEAMSVIVGSNALSFLGIEESGM